MTKVMTTSEGGKIQVWGKGKEERDLLYISDLIQFIDLGLEKQENNYELCNVGCGSAISVSDLVKKIIDISGKNLKIEYNPNKPSINTKVFLDTSKAKKTFGWKPKISLDDGIKKTMKWYCDNMLKKEDRIK